MLLFIQPQLLYAFLLQVVGGRKEEKRGVMIFQRGGNFRPEGTCFLGASYLALLASL